MVSMRQRMLIDQSMNEFQIVHLNALVHIYVQIVTI